MDYPLRYLLEKLLKKYLKTYFETDKLNLNSLSLINSSIHLNNLILKPSEINSLDLPITLLSAQISELTISASLFQNKFSILANGIDINILLPSNKLDRFIFKQKENLTVNKEFIDSFLPDKHNQNRVYEVLKSIYSFDIELKEIRINLYIEILGHLFNFVLFLPEILSSSNQEEPWLTRIFKVNSSNLRLNTLNIPEEKSFPNTASDEKTLTFDQISKIMRTVEKTTNSVFEDLSFEIIIQACDFRFYKPESNVMEKQRDSRFREYNSSNCNNKINISINKIKLIYSQSAIMSILLLCKCYERFSSNRREKRQKALNNFRNFVYNYHHENKVKKHISWVNEKRLSKVNKDEIEVRLIFYIFLIMIKKEYIKYNISKYLVIELIRNYRKSIGTESSILDYLIDSNINVFLNAPTINSIGGMFMSINEIEKYINRAENKKLREFIFFILKEYKIIKGNIEMYNSYDDYFCVSLKISIIDIFLEKSNEIPHNNTTLIKDDLWEIIYYKYNQLESKNTDKTSFDFNNTLLKVEFRNIDMELLTNVKENMVCEVSFESLNVLDIGYKTLTYEKTREKKYQNDKYFNSLPLLNIQYKFTLSLEKWNNDVVLMIDIPKVYVCLDPITLYLIRLYFQNISRRIEMQKTKTIEEVIENNSQANKKGISFFFKKVKVSVIKLIVNLNKTNIADTNDKSLLLKFNLIDFCFEREIDKIVFELKEFACGSIDTHQIFEHLNSRKIILYFRSTIINLFDLSLNISMKDRSIKIPLPKAFLDFKKQDLACVMNYIHMIKTVEIFEDYMINNNEVIRKQNRVEENEPIKENLSIYFLDVSVEKLYFKFHLEIDSKFSQQISEPPTFIMVLVDSPKLIISSTDYTFNIIFNLKNLAIARGFSTSSNHRLNESFNSGRNKILYIQSENIMDISNIYVLQDFLDQDKEKSLFFVQFSTKLNINQITVRIPPLHYYFDHELLSFLLNFFNGLVKTNLEKEGYLKQLLVKSDNNRIRKQSRIPDILKEQTNEKSIRQTEINIKMKESNIEIIYKKESFLSIKLTDIDINNNSKVNELNINMIMNSITDERVISSNNKSIIFGDFKLNMVYRENLMKIKLLKPKITFLKRIVMDLVEYFYYILVLEVFSFNNVNTVKEELKDNTNIISNQLTNIKVKKNAKSTRKNSSYNASFLKEEKGMYLY